MPEDTTQQPVVEENNQPAPSGETTLTEQPNAEEPVKPEQAAPSAPEAPKGGEGEGGGEPSESNQQPVEGSEGKPQPKPRIQRRFDKMSAKMADLSKEAQLSPAQILAQQNAPRIEPGKEYDAEELDQIMNQKANAISRANNAQLLAGMQAQNTVQTYINNITEDVAYLKSKFDITPEDEETITDLYDRANPIEVNGQYNPRVDVNYRLRDVAEKYLSRLEASETKGQVNASKGLQEAEDGSVIKPTGITETKTEETTEDLREKLANHKF